MDELASIGARLRTAGLTERALAAWAGTSRIAALPARIAAMPPHPPTPAAAVLALLVGGAALAPDQLRTLPAGLARALVAHQLLERTGERLRARVAIVPVGAALLVCDRFDAPVERELVCWPDDSSHHLATAIPPGRRASWLDLGCGSAFAPLARPELAARIRGVDLNERAVRHAQLGAALSGIAHITAARGDAGAPHDPADLVTCNAPMPAGPSPLARALPELWRHADRDFFPRLWPALAQAVRPGGMIVVHAARDAILSALAGAPGERVIVAYTPVGAGGFAIAWWRPDAPDRFVAVHRALTPDRPHLDPRDRDDALAR
ncbi:MAG TPA: methyltransferase [Kofleriaceae bacterium]|nr:methyltransferase [Kofleriaceae bacterium]